METDPCPWKIVEGVGGAFCLGAIGGTVLQSHRGYREAPKGPSKRFLGMMNAVKTGAPRYGTGFAVWAGSMDAVECGLIKMRGKQDPWNRIIAGGVAGGMVSVRSGWATMIGSTMAAGVVMSLIEGVIILQGNMDDRSIQQGVDIEDPKNLGPPPFIQSESHQSQETIPPSSSNLATWFSTKMGLNKL